MNKIEIRVFDKTPSVLKTVLVADFSNLCTDSTKNSWAEDLERKDYKLSKTISCSFSISIRFSASIKL
ncbi:hypothetical protein BH11BAC5_BH11BAC5_28820 [soil metagenome]